VTQTNQEICLLPENRTQQRAEGIWQFKKSITVSDDNGKVANDTFTFFYRGGKVILRLITLHPGQWKSDDDFYELSTRWEGDTLYYLPPFGDWTELAVFEDEHFVNIGSGVKRIFEKIAETEVADWNRNITTAREPHDYRIKPDGSLKK
jgi:hypothetical protein